jgi:hypothetical protein
MNDRWRLKIQRPGGTREADRAFADLSFTLFALRQILAARPGLRIAITVPPDATEEERYFISQIANRSTEEWF